MAILKVYRFLSQKTWGCMNQTNSRLPGVYFRHQHAENHQTSELNRDESRQHSCALWFLVPVNWGAAKVRCFRLIDFWGFQEHPANLGALKCDLLSEEIEICAETGKNGLKGCWTVNFVSVNACSEKMYLMGTKRIWMTILLHTFLLGAAWFAWMCDFYIPETLIHKSQRLVHQKKPNL